MSRLSAAVIARRQGRRGTTGYTGGAATLRLDEVAHPRLDVLHQYIHFSLCVIHLVSLRRIPLARRHTASDQVVHFISVRIN